MFFTHLLPHTASLLEEENCTESFQFYCYSKLLRILWMNNTTNERYVLEHTNVEKSVKLGEVFEPQIRWSFDKKME